MKKLFIYIFVFYALHTFSSNYKEFNYLITYKSIDILEKKLNVEFENVHIKKNQITPNYFEYNILLDKCHKINQNEGTCKFYKLEILCKDNNIFYSKFYKVNNKYPEDRSKEYIEGYINDSLYNVFKNNYCKYYNTNIDNLDLFNTDIIYGISLGIAGVKPPYKIILDSLVKTKNIDEIREWLKCANPEKQLFALEAYKLLKYYGYSASKDELNIINKLKNKNTNCTTCSGCNIFEFNNFDSKYQYIQKSSVYNFINDDDRLYRSFYGVRPINFYTTKEFVKKLDNDLISYMWLILLLSIILLIYYYFIK